MARAGSLWCAGLLLMLAACNLSTYGVSHGGATQGAEDATAPTGTATGSTSEPTGGETGVLDGCGDGIVGPQEECDDGNLDPGDTCSRSCRSTVVVGIALGALHTCVVFDTGRVRCWGAGGSGVLGNGSSSSIGGQPGDLPAPDVDIGGEALQVVAGQAHTCVLLENGSVRCWGWNNDGVLGYGDGQDRGDQPGELPTKDLVLGTGATRMSAGARHTCVRTTGGAARCWGGNTYAQLGSEDVADVGASPSDMPPAEVVGVGAVDEVTAGNIHTCALKPGGAVKCWGSNSGGALGFVASGQVGDEPGEMPPPDLDLGGPAIRISAGVGHACAILEDASVRCWGRNSVGQLGYGHTDDLGGAPGDMPPPAVDLGGPAAQIAAGDGFTCALLESGEVKCWGSGARGQLGTGNTNNYGDAPGTMPPPSVDLGGEADLLVSSQGGGGGLAFSCALLFDKTMRCWGVNGLGNLGYPYDEDVGDDETPASAGPVPF